MNKLFEACKFFQLHLDYLRSTWGDEGITRRVSDLLGEVIQEAEQPVTREWLSEVLGESDSEEGRWKVHGASACFLVSFHDIHPEPVLCIAIVSAGIHPLCDIPASSRGAFLSFTELMGIES